MGRHFVLPTPRGLKRLYLRLFGIPDVRAHLTAAYALREIAPLEGGRALDVGCGNGAVTCLLASRYPAWEFVGLDRDAAGVGYATSLARQNGLANITFRAGDVESDGMTGTFDLVTAFAVLQFIGDCPRFMRGVNRVLRLGGHVLLQLPVGRQSSAEESRQTVSYYPEFHEARGPFTANEAQELLMSSGFDVVRMIPVLKGPSVVAKRLFYRTLAAGRAVNFACCPILNWITAFDRWYRGRGDGLFVLARKRADVPNDQASPI